MSGQEQKRFRTSKELATELGVTTNTIAHWIKTGVIDAERLGVLRSSAPGGKGQYRFPIDVTAEQLLRPANDAP